MQRSHRHFTARDTSASRGPFQSRGYGILWRGAMPGALRHTLLRDLIGLARRLGDNAERLRGGGPTALSPAVRSRSVYQCA